LSGQFFHTQTKKDAICQKQITRKANVNIVVKYTTHAIANAPHATKSQMKNNTETAKFLAVLFDVKFCLHESEKSY